MNEKIILCCYCRRREATVFMEYRRTAYQHDYYCWCKKCAIQHGAGEVFGDFLIPKELCAKKISKDLLISKKELTCLTVMEE